MANVNGDKLITTLKELESKINSKRTSLLLLDEMFRSLCNEIEENAKLNEDLVVRMYGLENSLNSAQCRLKQYDPNLQVWINETNVLNKKLEEVKLQFEEEKHQEEKDNTSFNENLLKMIEEQRQERTLYDNNMINESSEHLQEKHNSIVQETADIRKILLEMKQKFPLVPSEEVTFVLRSLNLKDSIEPEIEAMKKIKESKRNELANLTDEIRSLEDKIRSLEDEVKYFSK